MIIEELANLLFGILYSTDGGRLAFISIIPGDRKNIFVSPEYVVFPEPAGKVDKDGPFVTVVFSYEPAKEAEGSSVRLVVLRNGKKVSEGTIEKDKDVRVTLNQVQSSNDVWEWSIEDPKTKAKRKGAIGFPVRGARRRGWFRTELPSNHNLKNRTMRANNASQPIVSSRPLRSRLSTTADCQRYISC